MEPTPQIISIGDVIDVVVLGYFLYVLKTLSKKVDDTHTTVTQLYQEHETLKHMNKCPLIAGAKGHEEC